MDCSPSSSSVHGILQARILGWVAMGSKSHDVLTPNPPSFPGAHAASVCPDLGCFYLLTCSCSLNPCDSRNTLLPSSWPEVGVQCLWVKEGCDLSLLLLPTWGTLSKWFGFLSLSSSFVPQGAGIVGLYGPFQFLGFCRSDGVILELYKWKG